MTESAEARVAAAIMADIKRQMNGQPIPGVPDALDSWSARGDMGTLDVEQLARAAIGVLAEECALIAEARASLYSRTHADGRLVCSEIASSIRSLSPTKD